MNISSNVIHKIKIAIILDLSIYVHNLYRSNIYYITYIKFNHQSQNNNKSITRDTRSMKNVSKIPRSYQNNHKP